MKRGERYFRLAREAISAWSRPVQEPLFWLAGAAVAGILAADTWPHRGIWATAAGVALLAALATRRRLWVGAALLTSFGLLHSFSLRDPLRLRVESVLAPGASLPARVTGVVWDAPAGGYGGDTWQFPLRVDHLTSHGQAWDTGSAKLHVRLTGTVQAPAYGDRIVLTGLLRRSAGVRNPGELNFDRFQRRQGYAAEFAAEGTGNRWLTLEGGKGHPVMAAALKARDWIAATVTRDLEDAPEIAATVRTMVLGTREKTPDELTDAFRASGTMHIFSVSGLHVALFAGVLWFVLSRSPLPRAGIIGVTLTVVFFYVFVTGLRPSAWRAALMIAMVLLAPLWNRESHLMNSLGAAALLLLAWNTQQLFQAGFVLSFGVLLAIALLAQPLGVLAGRLLGRWNAPDPFLPREFCSPAQSGWYWLREKLCLSLGVSTASTLGSMPLMIGYFNLITPVGIVANLFLVSLSLWILVVACLSLIAGAVGLTPLVLIWNNTNWVLAWCTIATARFFASLPFGHVRVDPARLWRGDPCEMTILALDHGGGAARVDTPSGRQWMIDCGGLRHWNRTLRPHLERAPVNRLEGIFLTHPDSYHTGALSSLTRLFHPAGTWTAGRVPAAGGEQRLAAGTTWMLDRDTRLECLFPPLLWQAGLADDRAAVLRVECRGFRVLLMSDAGFPTEKALLTSGTDLRADVLVMGRHGSDFCGLPEFVRVVNPGAVVFSNHRFPESERAPEAWRQRLETMDLMLFDQAMTGAVTLRVDDAGLVVRAFTGGRQWRRPPRETPPWSVPAAAPGAPLIR